MKTISISPEDMEQRVARFADLKPLPLAETLDMSQEAKDVIYARQILSVIGLGEDVVTPVNKGAPSRPASARGAGSLSERKVFGFVILTSYVVSGVCSIFLPNTVLCLCKT